MRRAFRPQDFFRVRIKRDHDRRSVGGPGVFGRGRDDGLMAEMNAVKYSDREKYGAT
jgi:hypothetical protein